MQFLRKLGSGNDIKTTNGFVFKLNSKGKKLDRIQIFACNVRMSFKKFWVHLISQQNYVKCAH